MKPYHIEQMTEHIITARIKTEALKELGFTSSAEVEQLIISGLRERKYRIKIIFRRVSKGYLIFIIKFIT